MIRDLKLAIRRLIKSPGFTTVTALTLALGIGANAAIFALVQSTLLKPLPFPHPDRLVAIYERNPHGKDDNVISPANMLDWRAGSRTFEAVEAGVEAPANLAGAGDPREVPVGNVTPGYFQMLGVHAALGRVFREGSDGSENEVVLTHGFWKRQFGSDPGAIGRGIRIDDNLCTIVGVLPPTFELPGSRADLWVPFRAVPGDRTHFGRFLIGYGRLRMGVTVAEAEADLSRVMKDLVAAYPDFNAGWGVHVISLREALLGSVRLPLLLLMGAVSILMLIVCANVASLLLGRAAQRASETVVRLSLGATRGHLVRQVLAEGLVLATLGGLLGFVFADMAADLLMARASAAGELALHGQVTIGPPVVAFTALLTVATLFFFAVLPALVTSPSNLEGGSAREAGGRVSADRHRSRLRRTLIVAEVALALTLLAGAGLLGRSLWALYDVNPGFRADGRAALRLSLSASRYAPDDRKVAFADALMERVRNLPGVQSVGATNSIPIVGTPYRTSFVRLGIPKPTPGTEPAADIRTVAGDYFTALGIPLRRGRVFDARDQATTARVFVVDEELAKRQFPNEDPIGHRLSVWWGQDVEGTIIGVAGSVHHGALKEPLYPAIYWWDAQMPMANIDVVAHSKGSVDRLASAMAAQVRALDPEQPIAEIRPLRDVLDRDVAQPRLILVMVAFFAGTALLLAGLGLYGVIANSVVQRTREIGIRVALGAAPGTVAGMIVRQGMLLAILGLIGGLAVTLAAGRLVAGAIYGVRTWDPLALVGAAAFLGLVSLIASWIPARRALRTDPMTALRQE